MDMNLELEYSYTLSLRENFSNDYYFELYQRVE